MREKSKSENDATARCEGRIALLVLACHAPVGLEVISSLFDDERFEILVHIDRKIEEQEYKRDRVWNRQVKFIEDRQVIFWGGFNMIRATEALINEALSDATISTTVLLSDDTLPLRPATEIYEELMSQSDRIDVGLYKKNPIFLQRYANLFFMDSNSTSVRPVKLEDRHINQKCIEDVLRLSQLQKRGKFPLDEVWGGSQWWSMSRTTVQAIVNELSSNLWLRESFEYSAIPDEMVFQTLYARLKNLSTRSFTSPMFTDMTKYPRPYVYKAISEFPEIPLGKLFVRKIDNSNALSVMEQIKHFWKSTK